LISLEGADVARDGSTSEEHPCAAFLPMNHGEPANGALYCAVLSRSNCLVWLVTPYATVDGRNKVFVSRANPAR
jgi:hypothetical protein